MSIKVYLILFEVIVVFVVIFVVDVFLVVYVVLRDGFKKKS